MRRIVLRWRYIRLSMRVFRVLSLTLEIDFLIDDSLDILLWSAIRGDLELACHYLMLLALLLTVKLVLLLTMELFLRFFFSIYIFSRKCLHWILVWLLRLVFRLSPFLGSFRVAFRLFYRFFFLLFILLDLFLALLRLGLLLFLTDLLFLFSWLCFLFLILDLTLITRIYVFLFFEESHIVRLFFLFSFCTLSLYSLHDNLLLRMLRRYHFRSLCKYDLSALPWNVFITPWQGFDGRNRSDGTWLS